MTTTEYTHSLGSSPDDCLLEIRTEEMPARLIPEVLAAFPTVWESVLKAHAVAHQGVQIWITPCRIVVLIRHMAGFTSPEPVRKKGPPVAGGLDAAGQPQGPLQGFLKQQGIGMESVIQEETPKGRYFFAVYTPPAQPVETIFPAMLSQAIRGLKWEKTMRWGKPLPFPRPIRSWWVQHGATIWSFTCEAIPSVSMPTGHRIHHPGPVTVSHPQAYHQALLQAYVCVDHRVRAARIAEAVGACAAQAGGQVASDPALMEEITFITEWPQAVVGSFNPAYLQLPKALILAVLTQHQRYIAISDPTTGQLLPRFIAVANVESADAGQMVRGFERVLEARLADAWYFYQQDLARPLSAYIPRLQTMMQHQHIGSFSDQHTRLRTWIGQWRPTDAPYPVDDAEQATAYLWADLGTQVVQEFPELHGIMGQHYLEKTESRWAAAVGESVLPRSAEGPLPISALGRDLALCEKADTMVGLFAVGKPTGTHDPYGVRRLGLALIRLLVDDPGQRSLPLLLELAWQAHAPAIRQAVDREALLDFCAERFKSWVAEYHGYAPGLYHAVAHTSPSPACWLQRMAILHEMAALPEWSRLVGIHKRVTNILRTQSDPQTQDSVCLPDHPAGEPFPAAEQALWAMAAQVAQVVHAALGQGDYRGALMACCALETPLAQFFVDVMVCDPDPAIRTRRLQGLRFIDQLIYGLADISQIALGSP